MSVLFIRLVVELYFEFEKAQTTQASRTYFDVVYAFIRKQIANVNIIMLFFIFFIIKYKCRVFSHYIKYSDIYTLNTWICYLNNSTFLLFFFRILKND